VRTTRWSFITEKSLWSAAKTEAYGLAAEAFRREP
jgi:hypothetical protein